MRTKIIFFFAGLFLVSCDNKYTDPSKMETQDYVTAVNEINANKKLTDSLFMNPNSNLAIRQLSLNDFKIKKNLHKVFPACYSLLKNGKAEAITRFSEKCILIVLKNHNGIFTDRQEFLKTSNTGECEEFTITSMVIEKKVILKNGWTYQIGRKYID